MEVAYVVKKLKAKKELADIDETFLTNLVQDYVKRHNLEKNFKRPDFLKTKKFKIMFKQLRKLLHEVYGSYKVSNSFYEHPSIKERLIFYKEIYYKIFSITGKPSSVLDLGCGLNPLSYKFLGCKPRYYAVDISKDYIKKVQVYFKKNNIKGRAFLFDLVYGNYNKLPKVDVCFLFKVLESLEAIKKNISAEILKKLKCKWIVVSFSKVVLSGKKKIRKKGRAWFRKLLKNLGYVYSVLDIGEEIFFVIRKP